MHLQDYKSYLMEGYQTLLTYTHTQGHISATGVIQQYSALIVPLLEIYIYLVPYLRLISHLLLPTSSTPYL